MQATSLFARESRTGVVFAGTGPNMAPFSNLIHYTPVHAEVIPPGRNWEKDPPSRIPSAGNLHGERPTSTLADEILQPGEGRVRGMLAVAGNPLSCVPDQRRTLAAIKDLELLVVVVDPYLTSTAAYAHYVLARTVHTTIRTCRTA